MSISQASDEAVDESELLSRVEDLLQKSFRVRERTTFVLDGSEAASSIQKTSTIMNELVYYGPTQWRVRREIPFAQTISEFGRLQNQFFSYTPTNRPISIPSVKNASWVEVILSIQRFAEQMGLIEPDLKFSFWLSELKAGRAKMQNNGAVLTYEGGKDGTVKLTLTGKILHEGKTEVQISSFWQMSDVEKVSEAMLKSSLIGEAFEVKEKEKDKSKKKGT